MSFLGLNKLSKEKRNELIMVIVITCLVLGGLGYGLVKRQYGILQQLAAAKAADDRKLDQMRNAIKLGSRTKADLEANNEVLAATESKMATGDLLSWFISTLRPFKQLYRVDIPQIGSPTVSEMTLLPGFPYKQATSSLVGTGRFYEIGRFIADLENRFPQIRVVNLSLEPSSTGTDQETLAFRIDIIMLVKPNPS